DLSMLCVRGMHVTFERRARPYRFHPPRRASQYEHPLRGRADRREIYSFDPAPPREESRGNVRAPLARTASMALRLSIVSGQLGAHGMKEFGPNGGTIGRSLECNWALPDTKRYLSSRHASIDFRSGSYYIIDTSTNGVYVNDAEQPVGRGKPQRLFA